MLQMLNENCSLLSVRRILLALLAIVTLLIFYHSCVPEHIIKQTLGHLNVVTCVNDDLSKENLTSEQKELLLSTKGKADWENGHSPTVVKRIDSLRVTMFSEKYTTINVLSAGFCHIRNLYLFNDTFYIVTSDSDVTTTIFGHEFRMLDCFPVPDVNVQSIAFKEFTSLFQYKPIQWQQTTIFSFQQKFENLLPHYFHFVEDLIGAWLVYTAAVESGTTSIAVQRVVYPGVSNEMIRGRNFRNSDSVNMLLLRGAFDNAYILEDSKWREQSKSNLIKIESAILASRFAAHAGDVNVQRSNKMTLGICHVLWSHSRINAFKTRIFSSLRLKDTSTKLNQSLVLYINRQPTNRRLDDSIHQRLLEELKKLQSEGWEVRTQKMEELSFAEQLTLVSHADVIVGVHGNGLTHGLWAPANGGIIELQPAGHRQMDYQWIAQLNDLKYASIDISGVEWEGRYQELHASMDGRDIIVNVELIGRIIRSWKDGPHVPPWRLARLF